MKRDTKQARRQSGFTLVELLFVIAIIAILSTLSLLVLRGAQDEARHGATESRVAQIKALLQQRLEDYEVRKIPLRLTDYMAAPYDQNVLRELKNRIIVDLISLEMPRSQDDVNRGLPSTTLRNWIDSNSTIIVRGNDLKNDLVALGNRIALRFKNQPKLDLNGEFLYQVVTDIVRTGEQDLSILGNSMIANVDNVDQLNPDPFFEFVDAWGDPITFEITDSLGNKINLDSLSPPPPSDLTQLVIHVESDHLH